MTFHLFEVSWEICNKVGGIHTAVTSKVRTLVERMGDRYMAMGPLLLDRGALKSEFVEEPGYDSFRKACAARGVTVRVGRWSEASGARTMLVGFADLYDHKDEILSALWDEHGVNSLDASWEYVEPVLFGHACGLALEEWHKDQIAGSDLQAVAHFHEWNTGAGLLHVSRHVPQIGTVFTAHAPAMGRARAATGLVAVAAGSENSWAPPEPDPSVTARHSVEGAAVRAADVFTTASAVTAEEAESLHGRSTDLILPGGLDLERLNHLAPPSGRAAAREKLARLAGSLHGEDLSDATFLAISGSYQFRNKGLDLLLEALRQLGPNQTRKTVLFALMPTGCAGMRRGLRQRMAFEAPWEGSLGSCTHELFEPESDPLQQHILAMGLDQSKTVRVVHVPIYLPAAAPLDLTHEAALGAVDLACFPSAYEPWGYPPAEALALGVPAITTDFAGFGTWASAQGIGPEDGLTILSRKDQDDTTAASELADLIAKILGPDGPGKELGAACTQAAKQLTWDRLIPTQERAHQAAMIASQGRGPASSPNIPVANETQDAHSSNQPRLMRFDASASLPEGLMGLARLARNLWWSWDAEATRLFHDISPRLWEAVEENPVTFLRQAWPSDLERVVNDADYVARLERVMARFDAYIQEPARTVDHDGQRAVSPESPAVYFCLEFGLHPSLPIYSGGLGILAGDHLKSASDRNLPLVAVGLFYRGGYVRQQLHASGEQQNLERPNDPADLPLELCVDDDGKPVEVTVQLPAGPLRLRAFEVSVGRVRLFLLDSDVTGNPDDLRGLTRRLYSGDSEHRLRQEIVLGKGGVKLLAALGIDPAVCHMNEGHAGFSALERIATLVHSSNLSFAEAREVVRAGTAFTTHTPVPAGHDVFSEDLVRRYFSDSAGWLHLPWEEFFALGCDASGGRGFNMTYLCMNLAGFVNGVAKKHGTVSRSLLHPFWAGLLEEEVPVTHVTNGIHLPTWTAPEVSACLGVSERPPVIADFEAAESRVVPAELWTARKSLKAQLMDAVRSNLENAFTRRQDDPKLLARMLEPLNEDALVIGFARRFAPYKRANLLLADRERLARLVNDTDRPVRFLFSGKAHPADELGQDLVREVASLCREEPFLGKVIFLEDYDMHIARRLVQGVDVWLNNPIPPLEASGTSGMKSAANGGLNLSVLDGWWLEGCDGKNGWGIGPDITFVEQRQQNQLDNDLLLRLLEDEVLPLYFDRDAAGMPAAWLERSIHALATLPTFFGTDRMVEEYLARAYAPCAATAHQLVANGFAAATQRATELRRLRVGFENVHIRSAAVGDLSAVRTGDRIEVTMDVETGDLQPHDLLAELVLGHPGGERSLVNAHFIELKPEQGHDGATTFRGHHVVESSGTYGWGLRVRPRCETQDARALPGLVRWA